MIKVLLAIEGRKSTGPNNVARMLLKSSNEKVRFTPVYTYNLFSLIKAFLIFYRFDVFHFYSQTPGAFALAIVFKISRKKIVHTLHGFLAEEKKSKKGYKRLLWMPLNKTILMLADIITTPSQKTLEGNQEILKNKKVVIVHNPYIFTKRKLKKIDVSLKNLSIYTITSFTHQRKAAGVSTLIKIKNKLVNELPSTKIDLQIIGGGNLLQYYQERFPNEVFKNYLKDAKNKLIDADLFLYCSFQDNSPIAILDAIDMNIPVFSNKVGAVGEMIPQEQLFSDVNEAVDKIKACLTNSKKYLEIVKKQKEMAKNKYSISKVILDLAEIYEEN